MNTISIIIPAFNEENTIGKLLQIVLSVDTEKVGFRKEIIVVDDGSTDDTGKIATNFPDILVIKQKNQGKGAAVQKGISQANGKYILIQDADLEYDPGDYIQMLKALNTRRPSVVYGSRVLGNIKKFGLLSSQFGKHPQQDYGPWFAGLILSFLTFFLYGKWISDTLTAYKIYPADTLRSFDIKTTGFETDHEITAKLLKAKVNITEVPISYFPRTVAEGKKIKFRDGVKAISTLFRFRIG